MSAARARSGASATGSSATSATTLFVEAGAGSGKTIGLGRPGPQPRHQRHGRAALRRRHHLHREGRRRAARPDPPEPGGTRSTKNPIPTSRQRCRLAIDQLDGAAIGTLHSFAQRILSENPVEAGLPPRVEVLDEVSSGVEFERRWAAFRDELLADPTLERTLLLLFAAGVKPGGAARARAGVRPELGPRRRAGARDERGAAEPPRPAGGASLAPVDAVCDAPELTAPTTPTSSAIRLDEIAEYADRLRAIDDELELLDAVAGRSAGRPRPKFKVGDVRQQKATGRWTSGDVQAASAEAGERTRRASGARSPRRAPSASGRRSGASRCAPRTNGEPPASSSSTTCSCSPGPAPRPRPGRRCPPAAARALPAPPPRRVPGHRPDPDRARRAHRRRRPRATRPATRRGTRSRSRPATSSSSATRSSRSTGSAGPTSPCSWRRPRRLGLEGGGVVELSANFRTVRADHRLGEHDLRRAHGRAAGRRPAMLPSQPDYVALDADPANHRRSARRSRCWARERPREGTAAELRTAEAERRRGDHRPERSSEGWSVGDGARRLARRRLGDITVLVPARTSLPFLEDALEAADIPYRAESSSLVYATRAVRDLLMVLRAVDDPTDHLAVVAALRIAAARLRRRRPVPLQGRAARSLELPRPTNPTPFRRTTRSATASPTSARCTSERHWLSPAELLDRIARDRRAFELGFAEGRPRDVWRRLRFVIDQARSWSEPTGGSLRQYLQWVDRQTARGAGSPRPSCPRPTTTPCGS